MADSKLAVEWAAVHENCWASVGVHPHEAKTLSLSNLQKINNLIKKEKNRGSRANKIVAIGEIGLDYHYMHSSRTQQIAVFEAQLQLAVDNDLPVIFHVREAPKQDKSAFAHAFDDFWAIIDNFTSSGQKVRGVLHSFTDTTKNAEKGIEKGLFIGVNGICTFTKDPLQQEMYKNLPLERIILETDAPYLTPTPKRGKINEPMYVRLVAKHLADLKNVSLASVASTTTRSVARLFGI